MALEKRGEETQLLGVTGLEKGQSPKVELMRKFRHILNEENVTKSWKPRKK